MQNLQPLPIYKIRKQSKLEKRIDEYLEDKAVELSEDYLIENRSLNYDADDAYGEAWEYAKQELEEDPKKVSGKKLLILNYLKTL